ncbi:MAG: TolC family protein [Burkholderiaceae bacterium]
MFVQYVARGLVFASLFSGASIVVAEQDSADIPATVTPSEPESAQKQVLSLEQAVDIARSRSALVQSLAAQSTAAQSLARSANALPDPVLSVGVNNWPISGAARFKLDEQLPTAVAVGVSRKLTRRDKLDARSQQFESQAALADAESALALAQLSRKTAVAWLDRAITRKLRELTIARLEENQRLLASAEAAFRSGRDAQTSVFDARLAIERTRDRLDEVDRELAIATVSLKRWIGAAAEHEPDQLPAFIWQAPETGAELAHPELALAQARIDLNQAKARVAETAQRADWTVGMSYGRRGAIFGDAISVRVSIPWQLNRQSVQTEQWIASRERVNASELMREELRRNEAKRIDALTASLQFLNKRIARYQFRMLPIAQQRAEAALAAYGGGSGSLGSVLMARRAQVDLQLEEIALERRAASVWAELTYLESPGKASSPEQESMK